MPNRNINNARRVATPNAARKISNLSSKVKTKQMGALLVATDVLSTRIFSFMKVNKKWLTYEPKHYAQIQAQPPKSNFLLFGP